LSPGALLPGPTLGGGGRSKLAVQSRRPRYSLTITVTGLKFYGSSPFFGVGGGWNRIDVTPDPTKFAAFEMQFVPRADRHMSQPDAPGHDGHDWGVAPGDYLPMMPFANERYGSLRIGLSLNRVP
jgi:hypothetical protein